MTHGSPFLRLLHWGMLQGFRSSWKHFAAGAENPASAQSARLHAILQHAAPSVWGRLHKVDPTWSFEEFQQQVPVNSYADLEPFIQRAANGEPNVLSTEPVIAFERTAGSTHSNKLIPYTQGLLQEFSAATQAWLHDLYKNQPGLCGTQSYWAISPAGRHEQATEGGIPIGLPSDEDYFPRWQRRALSKMMAVSSQTSRISQLDAWRDETLRQLFSSPHLGLVSVWHPSYFSLLLEHGRTHWDRLTKSLDPTHRRRLESIMPGDWRQVWPLLTLVSAWNDGSSAADARKLQTMLPGVPFQGKGLLATEGVVSIPILGCPSPVVVPTAHVLEFVDLEHPTRLPLKISELRNGGHYSPLLTTSGGLYRYRLADELHCVGHWRRLPMVEFHGRCDGTSDMCGEKISQNVAAQAVKGALAATQRTEAFAFLTPDSSGECPRYVLFIDGPLDGPSADIAARVAENSLRQVEHYAHCRHLGQLRPVVAQGVPDLLARWQEWRLAGGARLGNLKPGPLELLKAQGALPFAVSEKEPS